MKNSYQYLNVKHSIFKHTFLARILLTLMMVFVVFHLSARTPPKHTYSLSKDIVWTHVAGMDLKMDIYVPNGGQQSYPVIIIYHGGGWLINHKSDMDSLSVYLVSHANYVVCNVDYRLLGDNKNTTNMNEIVEDAMGAAIWVKENIAAYKGDGLKISVTGDSAGGQLASMVTLCGDDFSANHFGSGTLNFHPSWLPQGLSPLDYIAKGGLDIKAAILNYPAIDLNKLCENGFETIANPFWALGKTKSRPILSDTISHKNQPQYYKAVSPIYQVPSKKDRLLPPQLCIVGTMDVITPPHYVKKYVERCQSAGQPIEYWQYKGRPHAFLSPLKTTGLIINFTRDAPLAIDKMIAFLDGVFYKE